MRYFTLGTGAAILVAALSCGAQFAWAHGGGGGGGFGGGGGHMGGFGGGGHMGGFSGGHMGGFGGFSGGHHSGFGGMPMGGFSSGHHSGMGIGSFSGPTHHSGALGSSGLHSFPSMSGSHHSGLGTSTFQHNPNSFTSRHLGSGAVTQGYRGTTLGGQSLTSHLGGANAQSLLGHHGGSLSGSGSFLHHHGGLNSLGTHHLGQGGSLAGAGMNSMHHHNGGNYNNNHHHHNGNFFPFFPFFGFYPFGLGLGWPYYGYYGYGYPYGYGYGYGSYAYNPYGYYSYAYPATAATTTAAAPTTSADDAKVFAEKGETDFRAGNYKGAVYAWRHAAVDDPQNGVLLMMLGQALFATGEYSEAAGATQQAMALLPQDQWGVVVKNFRELYGKQGDYTTQLRALEKDVKTTNDNPATRFLLGFHYGFLGYPDHAVKQLEKTVKLAPQDQMAKQLLDVMGGGDGDKKPDAQPNDAGKQPDDKAARDGKPQDKPDAAKAAVDT